MPANPANRLLKDLKRQETATHVVQWDAIVDAFKVNWSWELTAMTQGLTLKELRDAFDAWLDRPVNVTTLEQWATQLTAQARTEYLTDLRRQAACGSRTAYNLYEEVRDNKLRRACDLLPVCCEAPAWFRQKASVEDVQLVRNKPFKCQHPEECRARCMKALELDMLSMQTVAVMNGNTKMLTYIGENILHQGTGGEAEFDPAHCDFVVKVED